MCGSHLCGVTLFQMEPSGGEGGNRMDSWRKSRERNSEDKVPAAGCLWHPVKSDIEAQVAEASEQEVQRATVSSGCDPETTPQLSTSGLLSEVQGLQQNRINRTC